MIVLVGLREADERQSQQRGQRHQDMSTHLLQCSGCLLLPPLSLMCLFRLVSLSLPPSLLIASYIHTGKSGPLFHFDVHDDVRMHVDASVEKDESHAGKVVTKAYYERNKVSKKSERREEGK